MKTFSFKKLFIFMFLFAFFYLFVNQFKLQKGKRGNFTMHLSYRPVREKCVDFSVSLNGNDLFLCDSLGKCANIYHIDSTFNLPIGFNTIRYSSDSLGLEHEEKVFNLLFIWQRVDLNEYIYPRSKDSIILIKDIYSSYFPIRFI